MIGSAIAHTVAINEYLFILCIVINSTASTTLTVHSQWSCGENIEIDTTVSFTLPGEDQYGQEAGMQTLISSMGRGSDRNRFKQVMGQTQLDIYGVARKRLKSIGNK